MNIKNFLLALFMLLPLPGQAQAEEEYERERISCFDYNRYGQSSFFYCRQDTNCQWRNFRCENRFTPRPATCENIRGYNRCIGTQGCTWNNRFGCVRGYYGGGQSLFECNARDRGWEEHPRGHVGQGRTQWEAQNAALRVCLLSHGQCFVSSCRRIR